MAVLDRVPAHETVKAAIEAIPDQAWRAAVDGDGEPRDGAQVAELTAWMPARPQPATGTARDWPPGMRVIARRERPHPGAQLRLTDHNGWRITCFATNTRGPGWTLPALEVRHRQRARCEDRIRALKDTGLRNLPFHGFAHNRIWLEIVALAADLLAWTQTLAFDQHEPARRWEPKRLRFRILAVAGRDRPHRPTTTTPAPTRLALEPPHRHRLGSNPQHLTQHPNPTTRTSENRRTTAPELGPARPTEP